MNRTFFDKILEDIMSDIFFQDYKYKKSLTALFYKLDDTFLYLGLDHWRDYETEELVFCPIYGKHFNILCKWFEKFSFKKLQDQRNNPHMNLSNADLGCEDENITFKYDLSDYDQKIDYLIKIMKRNITIVANRYATLEDFYNNEISPIMNGEKDLIIHGADWIFRDLTLCHLVSPENYPCFKSKILNHIEVMHRFNEPNIERYYEKLDEIISYMEMNVKL